MELSQGTPISIKLRTKVKQQGEVQDFYFDLKIGRASCRERV